jgi:subtilisin family serine protease
VLKFAAGLLSLEGAHAVRKLALLLALVAATTLLATGVAFTQVPENGDPNRYIVVLEDDVASPSQVANGISRRQNLEIGFVYSNVLKGFSATIPDGRLAAVRADPRVAYVERDVAVHAVKQELPWGINRIDADESSTRAGNGKGRISGVRIYVIDSGIDTSHADLNVVNHVNFIGGKNTDCGEGHGTHIAGTLAAKDNTKGVVGVAPGAPLIGVKILDCSGGGTTSTALEAIDWVTANARRPAIANISFVGETTIQSLDSAVRKSADRGIFYSIAAGNYGKDACNYSPARAGAGKRGSGIVTTAAMNKSGDDPSWSNYGHCVDIWAPGTGILSTRNGGGTTTMSGTSVAAPHVGGTGALYLSSKPRAAPATVERALKSDSVRTGEKSKDDRRIRLVYAGGY